MFIPPHYDTYSYGYVSRYNVVVLPPVSWTEWSEDHIARHSITPREVEDVLYGRPRYVTGGRDDTTLVFGTTASGRRLLVVVAEAADGGLTVVTAREMTLSETRLFQRKGN